MRQFLFCTLIILLNGFLCHAFSQSQKPIVYLIPGQGADARLYKNIQIDSTFELIPINYFTPEKGWKMNDFARELAKQIDTTRQFSVVGVSMGGMLATEMTEFLNPEKVILISSAKSRKEYPFRYRFQRVIPIHKIIPGFIIKIGARILQPIFEPDRNHDKATFKAMLKDKDPKFMNRTVKMIMEWERVNYGNNIIHIHGDYDNTLPIRNIKADYIVKEGSHMMVLTQGALVSEILNRILLSEE